MSDTLRALAAVLISWTALALPAAAAPAKVVVGAYFNDVQSLDLKRHSYEADVYVWFRWRDRRLDPAASVEFMNPNELWGHARTVDYAKPVRLPSGELYQVLRAQGRFTSKMDLQDYPFDRQVLAVEFEDQSRPTDKLVYVADDGQEPARSPQLKLPGFRLGEAKFSVSDYVFPTRFGDPRAEKRTVFSRARLELPITRPAATYSVKLLLPIACVIFCAALMVFFDPKHVDARVGIGITALLTIVALQITLNDDLPEVDYLVLMDKIYLGAYVFVILALGLVVRTTRLMDTARLRPAVRLEQRTLLAGLLVYLVAVAGLLLAL